MVIQFPLSCNDLGIGCKKQEKNYKQVILVFVMTKWNQFFGIDQKHQANRDNCHCGGNEKNCVNGTIRFGAEQNVFIRIVDGKFFGSNDN